MGTRNWRNSEIEICNSAGDACRNGEIRQLQPISKSHCCGLKLHISCDFDSLHSGAVTEAISAVWTHMAPFHANGCSSINLSLPTSCALQTIRHPLYNCGLSVLSI